MSSAAAEVIRAQVEAVNERDFGRARSLYAEDVVLNVHVPGLREGRYAGRPAVEEWFGDWFRTFDRDARFDIAELAELRPGHVLLVAEHFARGRASGVEVHDTVVWTYDVRNGKIATVNNFPSRDAAVAAAQASSAGSAPASGSSSTG